MSGTPFNVRVYGLIFNEHQEVLLTDEYRFGITFTKFPGGGLEFGEGTIECLKREALEEMYQPIEVLEHFYTTDFFQPSAFDSKQQIMSIYYRCAFESAFRQPIKQQRYDFDEQVEGAMIFRWQAVSSMTKDDLSFPIDQHVLTLLQNELA